MRIKLLIFILCFVPSLACGQNFNTSVRSDYYSNTIPNVSDDNLAVLYVKYHPYSAGNVNDYVIDDVSILPSYTASANATLSGYGWSLGQRDGAGSFRSWYMVCNSTTLFGNTSPFSSSLLNVIYPYLESKGLGTISQRKAYIGFLKRSELVTPLDFRSYLVNWILYGILIFLAIPPLWWVIKRFIR